MLVGIFLFYFFGYAKVYFPTIGYALTIGNKSDKRKFGVKDTPMLRRSRFEPSSRHELQI